MSFNRDLCSLLGFNMINVEWLSDKLHISSNIHEQVVVTIVATFGDLNASLREAIKEETKTYEKQQF